MLCMRWGGSIVGTCEIGLAELTKDRGACAVAEFDRRVFDSRRIRRDRRENPYLDPPRAGKTTGRR
jgi:hypothetical protein